MLKVDELRKHLTSGEIYRRSDLAKWSGSIDRHIAELVKTGELKKLLRGLYYTPKTSAFGAVPPTDEALVRAFLKEDSFLLITPNLYNRLGLGTTQLYNLRIVYNHKRSGLIILGSRNFNFQIKQHFPRKLSKEFLVVDMVNNLDTLAEDRQVILLRLAAKLPTIDTDILQKAITDYGSAYAKKILNPLLSEFRNSITILIPS